MLRLGNSPALREAINALSKGPPLDPGIDSDRDRQWSILLKATDQALHAPEGKVYLLAHPDLPEVIAICRTPTQANHSIPQITA
jgi:hypothetical protein